MQLFSLFQDKTSQDQERPVITDHPTATMDSARKCWQGVSEKKPKEQAMKSTCDRFQWLHGYWNILSNPNLPSSPRWQILQMNKIKLK